MKIWYDGGGKVVAMTTDGEETKFGTPPGAAGSISFDEDANQAVVDALSGRTPGVTWQDHTVAGGKLKRKGVDVVIKPDSQKKNDKNSLAAAVAKLQSNANLSNAETAVVLRFLLRSIGQSV